MRVSKQCHNKAEIDYLFTRSLELLKDLSLVFLGNYPGNIAFLVGENGVGHDHILRPLAAHCLVTVEVIPVLQGNTKVRFDSGKSLSGFFTAIDKTINGKYILAKADEGCNHQYFTGELAGSDMGVSGHLRQN